MRYSSLPPRQIYTNEFVSIEVEALQAEVAEGKSQLCWLREKLEEVDAQKQEATTAIEDAQKNPAYPEE